ncbi:MAG: roadblock/LC7 domain-containing protein [Gemmatimonadaceae bacterium]
MLRTTFTGEWMPTIRELVSAIAQREGVEAAIVLGHDGLLIDGSTTGDLDAELLAALTPGIVAAAGEFAAVSKRGAFVSAIIELDRGIALLSSLTADALLLVLVHPSANVGSLLYEVRSHRGHIASLV